MIFIGYTSKLGRVDIEGIESYRKKNEVEKVMIFCREEPAESVAKLIKDMEIIVVENPRKEARKKAKELKSIGEKVEVFDLQDFGERAIRDVC